MKWDFEYESDMTDVNREYREEFKKKGYEDLRMIIKNITTEQIEGNVYKIVINFWDDIYLLKWTIDLDEAKFSLSGEHTRGIDLVFVDADYTGDRIKKSVIYYNELLFEPETELEKQLLDKFNPLGLHKIAYGLEIIALKYDIEKHSNKEE